MGKSRITVLLALGATLLAAEPDPAPRTKAEASATVTVTAEASLVETTKTPNPVVVVDKNTLERLAPRNAGELFQDLFPGQVLSNGGVGTTSSFFLGGARNQDVVVTLDGIRLQDPMGLSGVNLSTVSLMNIDRVEVQQGACSTGQGANALGGAVALYSAGSAPDGFSGSASFGAGNHNIRRTSAAPAFGWGDGWVRIGVDASQEDQAIPVKNPYRTAGTSIGLGQQLGDSTLLTANFLDTYSATPIPFSPMGYDTLPRASTEFDDSRETNTRSQVFSTTLRTALSSTLSAELNLGGWEQVRLDPDFTTGQPTQRYASRGSQFTQHVTWARTERYSIAGILDLSKEWGVSPVYAHPGLVNLGRGQHTAYALEGFLEPIKSVRITGALRQQEDQLELQPTGASTTASRTSSATTAKVGLNWTLPAGFRIYTSGGTSYSHPMLFQALYNLTNAGPELQNEKSYTLQAGANWEKGPWRARMELSRTRFQRLIYWDQELGQPAPWGGMTGAYQSGSNVRIQSVLWGLGYLAPTWGVEGFYRNQEARDLDQPEDRQLSAQTVIRRPFQSLGLNGYWIHGDLRLEGRWSWFGSRYEYGLPFAYKAHFNDLSLSASYLVHKDLTLTLKGDHLLQSITTKEDWLNRKHDFENDAAMTYGFPAQPPTISLDAKYRF